MEHITQSNAIVTCDCLKIKSWTADKTFGVLDLILINYQLTILLKVYYDWIKVSKKPTKKTFNNSQDEINICKNTPKTKRLYMLDNKKIDNYGTCMGQD